MPGNAIFLSVHPQYADRIIEGAKTVDLRRVRPKYITEGALVLIYVTSPVKSLIGAFQIEQVVEKPLLDLWNLVEKKGGISREEFDRYFHGTSYGIGLFFSCIWLFRKPIGLEYLRKTIDFRPPQSFRYATASELSFPEINELIERTQFFLQAFLESENIYV